MKKRLLSCVFGVLSAAIAVAVAVAFFTPEERGIRKKAKTFDCVRIATVYATLVEHPEARLVLLAGDAAVDYRTYFERAGVVCTTEGDGPFDIVFVAGADPAAAGSALGSTLAAGGVVAVCIDARDLPAPRFWNLLTGFPTDDFRFWMPGESDWLVVGRRGKADVRLSAMMDLFAREEGFADLSSVKCDSLASLFAAYVGAKSDVLPAFNGSLENVRADNFVTRETPSFAWIDTSGVDADIAGETLSAIRSAQIVRRMVLAGNLYAARGDEKKSAETWARAASRNPGDPLIVERLERLAVNGKVFLQLGKAAMAARCYETMAQILPDDPMPVYNYGVCLRNLGKKDLAARAFDRARALEKARGSHAETTEKESSR